MINFVVPEMWLKLISQFLSQNEACCKLIQHGVNYG